MNAIVIDFFEWKYNHNLVVVKSTMNRYREYLEMELAEALRRDNEEAITPHTEF